VRYHYETAREQISSISEVEFTCIPIILTKAS